MKKNNQDLIALTYRVSLQRWRELKDWARDERNSIQGLVDEVVGKALAARRGKDVMHDISESCYPPALGKSATALFNIEQRSSK
jgi:hypothetical protein